MAQQQRRRAKLHGRFRPFAFGVVAAGGGSAKFYFDAKGDYDKSDATPTSNFRYCYGNG